MLLLLMEEERDNLVKNMTWVFVTEDLGEIVKWYMLVVTHKILPEISMFAAKISQPPTQQSHLETFAFTWFIHWIWYMKQN